MTRTVSEILEELDGLHKTFVDGDQPRKWVPDPEIDYRDGEMCSVCGASDIARFDDDVEDSYCTSCAVNSREAFQAAAASTYPALREEIERCRKDIGILVSMINGIRGATGEGPEDEDAAIFWRIAHDYVTGRRTLKGDEDNG